MTRQMLMDNVYLTHVPSEKFKTSFFSAQMAAPLRPDTAGLNALLVNVLSRGTARLPDMTALGRELDMLYGARLGPQLRRMGENQVFGFTASCVDDRFLPPGEELLEKTADLMGDMFCAPALQDGRLRADYADSERANLIDEIRSIVNDKRVYAARRLLEEMCAGEPYSVRLMGSAEDMERITPEALDSHYRAVLPQGRLELFYCGSAPLERVAGAFTRAFARLPRQGLLEPAATTRRSAPPEPRVVTEEMDVSQGKLGMGFRTQCPDVPANLMLDAMFGGTSTSKLFLNVREKLSLCYYASSMLDKVKGLMVVSSGVEFSQFDRAQAAILAQLEEVKRGGFTKDELTAAIRAVAGSLRGRQDSQGQMEDDRLTNVLFHSAAGEGEELIRAVESVTADQVTEAARGLKLDTVYRLTGKEG